MHERECQPTTTRFDFRRRIKYSYRTMSNGEGEVERPPTNQPLSLERDILRKYS